MADTKLEMKQSGTDATVVADRGAPHAPEHGVPANKDLAARVLPTPRAAVGEILEQKLRVDDQRQEQALYSGVWAGWSGVVAAMVKTPSADKTHGERQKLEALQEDIFHALAKEKKKKAFRESPIFQRIVAVMGPDVAESVTQKLETALSNNPSGLQANSAVLTQVAKDLGAVLERNQASLKISVSADRIAQSIETEISKNALIHPSLATPLSLPDEKVKALHAEITSLAPGKEQMVKVLDLYGSTKREEFAALLDAYDKTYGIPLVAHVAQMSGGSPAARAEVFEELVSVLTPEQKARHMEYGRAELALVLASLSVEQKAAEEGIKRTKAELLKTASHLADPELLNITTIASLDVAGRRSAIEAAVRKEFPGLSDAKDWQGLIKTMTAVQNGGASTDTVLNNAALLKLLGKNDIDPKQEPQIRERIARITLLMGDLVRYEDQVGQLGKIALGGNSNELALVTAAYTKMYGKEVGDAGSGITETTKAALAHLEGLAFRIADPRTSESERKDLIRERDAIEFDSVKTRVAIHLQGDKPDVARAQALLALFQTSQIDTPARRDGTYRQLAGDISRAITAADEYRQQWFKVTPDALKPTTVVKSPTTVNCATHHEKPRDISSEQVQAALLALAEKPAANKEHPLLYFKSETERKKALAELEELNRDAAKTQWFSEVLNPGYLLTKTKGPTAEQQQALLDKKKEAAARELDPLGKELDLLHERARAQLWAVEQSTHSRFLSHEKILENVAPLSPDLGSKVGAANRAALVDKLSQHLDPEKPAVVTAATITALREVARVDKAVQSVLLSVKPNRDPNAELSEIVMRLTKDDALKVKAFTNLHASGRLPGDAKVVFEQLRKCPPDMIAPIEAASGAEAKMADINAIMSTLTEQERHQVRESFANATGTTIGARARALIPTGPAREQVIIALVRSAFVTDNDVKEFFDGPMPSTVDERARTLHKAFADDKEKVEEFSTIAFPASAELRELGVLRAAAQIGGGLGDHNLVEESIRALDPVERAAETAVEDQVKRFSPAFAARHGIREIARARQGQTVVTLATDALRSDNRVASNVTLVVGHLGSDPARADAAYHQVRQTYFNASEMLLFRGLYREAVLNRKPEEKTRPLTGDFEKDLASAKESQSEYERLRNAALVKGGKALQEADKVTVKKLTSLSEEQQLGALIDLKKSGELDKHKDEIDPSKLKGDAKTYHAAVTEKSQSKEADSNNKVRAEALEIKHKVAVKGVTEQDAVALASGKSAAQMAEIKKVYPKVVEDLKIVAPKMATEMDGLFSSNETEQRKAVERVLMNSFREPIEFERILGMARSAEARQEILASIERNLANNGRYTNPNESSIVQHVRAQRSDFREIDAVLFSDLLARNGRPGHKLERQMALQLVGLRAQGASQLEKMDAFHASRANVVKDALRYSGDKSSHLGNAEADKARRLVTGWLRNGEIAATKDLIDHHNKHILAPMVAGEVDIRRSRELMRMGIAIVAKDMQQGVDKGVTLGSAQQVMTLSMRRDKEVAYKVFDDAKEREWKTEVARTEKWVGYADTTVMVGMMVAKTVVVTGATLYGSPALGLVVATAWNVGDKAYRVTLQGESMRSALVSGSIEFGLDLVFAGASAYAQSRVVFQAGKTAEKAVEGASKTIREWRWFEPVVKPTQVEGIVQKGFVWQTGHSDKLKGLFAEIKNGAQIGEKVAETGAAFQANAIKSQLAGAIDAVPEWMGVGANIWRKGGGGVPSELARLLTPRDKEERAGVAGPVPVKNYGQGGQVVFGPTGAEDPVKVVVGADPLGKAPQEQSPTTPPPQQWQVPLTLWSYIVVVEQALIAKPDPDLQAALDNLKALIASSTVTEAEALAAARRVQEAIEAAKERDKDRPEWSPYPDLAKALDGWLDAGNPWLALGGALFTYDPPARPPGPPPVVPPPAAPAPEVKPAKPPPGRPGPGLQIAMAPVGGMNGNGNSNGQKDPVVLAEGVTAANGNGAANVQTIPNANGVATATTYNLSNVNSQSLATAHFTAHATADVTAQRLFVMDALTQVHGHATISTLSAMDAAEAAKVVNPNRQANLTATSTQMWVTEVAEATALQQRDREKAAGSEIKALDQAEQTLSVAKVAGREAPAIKEPMEQTAVAMRESGRVSSSLPEEMPAVEQRRGASSPHATSESTSAEVALRETQPEIVESASRGSTTPSGSRTQEAVGTAAVSQSKSETTTPLPSIGTQTADVVAESVVAQALNETIAQHSHQSIRAEVVNVVPTFVAGQVTAAIREGALTASPQSTSSELSVPPEIRAILEGEDAVAPVEDVQLADGPPVPRARSKKNPAADARMRAIILRQLMETHFAKSQREKLLKMLIALGISETEYRALVIKLGEMDVAQKAEAASATKELLFAEDDTGALEAQPHKLEVPGIKIAPDTDSVSSQKATTPEPKTTRAELFRRLRDESAPKLKGA